MPSHSISKLIAISIDGKKQLLKQGHNVYINTAVKLKDEEDEGLKIQGQKQAGLGIAKCVIHQQAKELTF